MSASVKALGRVRRVRERLRDAAAGAVFREEARRADADRARAEAARVEEQRLSEARQDISSASSGVVLLRIGELLRHARERRVDAERVLAQAEASLAPLRAELVRRGRELRVVERLLERAVRLRNSAERREEQRVADDLSAARRA